MGVAPTNPRAGQDPATRFYAQWKFRSEESEAELQAELELVRVRQHAGHGLTGESAVAGVFEAQAENRVHVIAQSDAIVDAVAIASDIGGCRRFRELLATGSLWTNPRRP